MLLDELKELNKNISEVKCKVIDIIGGSEWLVSIHDHYSPFQFGVWLYDDNGEIDLNRHSAVLSEEEILDCGKYTEEQLQPLLDRIKSLSKGDE